MELGLPTPICALQTEYARTANRKKGRPEQGSKKNVIKLCLIEIKR